MQTKSKTAVWLLVGMAVALLAMPTAASASKAKNRATQSALKQVRALQKKDSAMRTELTALQAKAAALEGRAANPNSAQETGPKPGPGGPGGGDLGGTYPNPLLLPNSISSTSILDGTLQAADLAPDSVNPFDLADQSLGSLAVGDGAVTHSKLDFGSAGSHQLLATEYVRSAPTIVANNTAGAASIACEGGSRLLGGGSEWEVGFNEIVAPGSFTLTSRPNPNNPNQWDVLGFNQTNGPRALFAYAVCLSAR